MTSDRRTSLTTDRRTSFQTQTQEQHSITHQLIFQHWTTPNMVQHSSENNTWDRTPFQTTLYRTGHQQQHTRRHFTTNNIYDNTSEIIVPSSSRLAYTEHIQPHEINTTTNNNHRTINNPTRHCDKKTPPLSIIGHQHHLPHKHSLQHTSNHQRQLSASIVSLFGSEKVICLTTLDSYDSPVKGWWNRIQELRSAYLEWMCGARMIEWSIPCSSDVGVDVQVVKVEMVECWVMGCSSGVGMNVWVCSWPSSIYFGGNVRAV